jgi:hypothetical protein
MEKSANKLWRESGSTLSFKEWIDRENQKKESVVANFIGEDLVDKTLNNTPTTQNSGELNTKSVLGLNKGVVILSSLLIVGSLSYYFYMRLKNRK